MPILGSSGPIVGAGGATLGNGGPLGGSGVDTGAVSGSLNVTLGDFVLVTSATIGSGGPKTASIVMVTRNGVIRAGLTGLKWAWFDQVTPDLFSAPTDKGTGESSDGAGVLTVTLTNTGKTSGQVGWLIVTDSNGSPSQNPEHLAFSGPVAVD